MTALVMDRMPKKRADVMTRIFPASIEAAKIACACRGMSLVEYVSLVVKQAADRDIDEWQARRNQARPKSK